METGIYIIHQVSIDDVRETLFNLTGKLVEIEEIRERMENIVEFLEDSDLSTREFHSNLEDAVRAEWHHLPSPTGGSVPGVD